MTEKTIEIGTEVEFRETYRGNTSKKIGTVVEVSGERARVKWDRWEFSNGTTRPDGKRTWFQIKRLTVRS